MTIAAQKWIDVGQLVEGFGGNELTASEDLAGQCLDLHFENGWVISHDFLDANRLNWKINRGPEQGLSAAEYYRATCLRPGIYLVDFVKASERATSVSLVLDLNNSACTAVIATLPSAEQAQQPIYQRALDNGELTQVDTVVLAAAIDAPFSDNSPRHLATEELVGKQIEHVYGPRDSYRHHYLSNNYFCWQCSAGEEKGLADTDRCHTLKIDHQLYLFLWREKVVPTLGLIMIDLQQGKTSGKLFGYQSGEFTDLANGPVGAKLTQLNT